MNRVQNNNPKSKNEKKIFLVICLLINKKEADTKIRINKGSENPKLAL